MPEIDLVVAALERGLQEAGDRNHYLTFDKNGTATIDGRYNLRLIAQRVLEALAAR